MNTNGISANSRCRTRLRCMHCWMSKPYLVGPLARVNLNPDRLPDVIHDILRQAGIGFPSRNMFHSIVARAVEIYYALLEAVRLLDALRRTCLPGKLTCSPVRAPGSAVPRRRADCCGIVMKPVTTGAFITARIVPPTSQNQARIEQDIRTSLQAYGLDHTEDELRLRAETVIRNYDPCISCATHFLKLKVIHATADS